MSSHPVYKTLGVDSTETGKEIRNLLVEVESCETAISICKTYFPRINIKKVNHYRINS